MKIYFKKIIIFLIILISITSIAFAEVPPDYKQIDKRWSDYPYTICNDPTQTIGTGGCSLAAICDIIAYWYNQDVTPITFAELSMYKFKTCSYDGGTYVSFFEKVAKEYPFSRFEETNNIEKVIKCLEEDGLVIVVFSGGQWEVAGENSMHTCCLYSYSENDGFRVHDPAWPEGIMSLIMGHVYYDDMLEYAKHFYCYWK